MSAFIPPPNCPRCGYAHWPSVDFDCVAALPQNAAGRPGRVIDVVGDIQVVAEITPMTGEMGRLYTLTGDDRDETAKVGDDGRLTYHRVGNGRNGGGAIHGVWKFTKS